MKIFGKENGKDTLYVQVKDLMLLGIYKDTNVFEEDFFKIDDNDLAAELYDNSRIVDFNQNISLSINELRKKIEELKDFDDDILKNYYEDLVSIYEYKMGRKKLALPAVVSDVISFNDMAEGINYIISRGVDPFKIILTKESGEEMKGTDKYPSQAIETLIGLMANSMGLEGYVGYEFANINLSDDKKTIVLEVKYNRYVSYMECLENEMNREIELEEKRKNSFSYKLFSKLGIFKPKK